MSFFLDEWIDEAQLWRKRANETADELQKAKSRIQLYKQALQKIQHTGYSDDPWVKIATGALRVEG